MSSSAETQKFGVEIFDSFRDAKQNHDKIKAGCAGVDQFNVVIREEGNMDDPEILGIDAKVRIFAGVAWTTIHERRIEEGWYQQ